MKINKNLKEKEQNIYRIKDQLVTLENNINAQVDEFLKSMIVTNLNLEAMLLESQRSNPGDSLFDNLC